MKSITKNLSTNNRLKGNYLRMFYGWDEFPRPWRQRLAQLWGRLRTPHYRAVWWPKAGPERALAEMVRGWVRYADSVLVPSGGGNCQAWSEVGYGLRALLDDPRGRLEGSTLRHLLTFLIHVEGNPSDEDRAPCDFDDDSLIGLSESEIEQLLFRKNSERLDATLEWLLVCWKDYAMAYRQAADQDVCEFDSSPSAEWVKIGHALRAMLTGSWGHVDEAKWETIIQSALEPRNIGRNCY